MNAVKRGLHITSFQGFDRLNKSRVQSTRHAFAEMIEHGLCKGRRRQWLFVRDQMHDVCRDFNGMRDGLFG